MNGQFFGERPYTQDAVEETNKDTNEPTEQVSVDPSEMRETPMVGTTEVGPQDKAPVHEAPNGANPGSLPALLSREESEQLRTRWNEIQGNFVDEPHSAVEKADALVTEVIGQITRMFDSEHSMLVSQWDQGNNVSTEDLRKALQRYRSFFNRLVA